MTTYTELNERDSEFEDFTHKKIEASSAREQQFTREIPVRREEIPVKREEFKKI